MMIGVLRGFATALFLMIAGVSNAQNCVKDSVTTSFRCFGSQASHPQYYGEWQDGTPTGVGVIKYSDEKVYIGGVANGIPEKRGVMLQGWNYGYGLWSSGWLARTEDMSHSFIYEQLSYMGENLDPKKSPEQLIETLGIKPSIVPRFAYLELPRNPSGQEKTQSTDDIECAKFGFVLGTPDYSRCLQALAEARAEAKQRQAEYELDLKRYEAERRAYEQRLAQYEEQKKQADKQKLIKFGSALMGGKSSSFWENLNNANRELSGLPPQAPSQPQSRNFTIIRPSGGAVNCNVFGSIITCN
ncbi:hypothetical protein [Hydrogenophaga sp.]|uniref:hypothetical protein n=1 Tax=Hydrogenophaga sp. TaxID=1904254 RepID=UPI003F6A68AA